LARQHGIGGGLDCRRARRRVRGRRKDARSRLARETFRAWRRAALDFTALLRRNDIKCSLQTAGAATVAVTPAEVALLHRDLKARRAAGLNATSLNARAIRSELGLDAGAASRDKEGATFNPYRACLGLATAAADRGARIFERTVVRRITFGRRTVDVFTAAGKIRAARVVIATGVPTSLVQSLADTSGIARRTSR